MALKDFHQFSICRQFYGTMASPAIDFLKLHLFYIFLMYGIFENKKLSYISSQWEELLRPYQH